MCVCARARLLLAVDNSIFLRLISDYSLHPCTIACACRMFTVGGSGQTAGAGLAYELKRCLSERNLCSGTKAHVVGQGVGAARGGGNGHCAPSYTSASTPVSAVNSPSPVRSVHMHLANAIKIPTRTETDVLAVKNCRNPLPTLPCADVCSDTAERETALDSKAGVTSATPCTKQPPCHVQQPRRTAPQPRHGLSNARCASTRPLTAAAAADKPFKRLDATPCNQFQPNPASITSANNASQSPRPTTADEITTDQPVHSVAPTKPKLPPKPTRAALFNRTAVPLPQNTPSAAIIGSAGGENPSTAILAPKPATICPNPKVPPKPSTANVVTSPTSVARLLELCKAAEDRAAHVLGKPQVQPEKFGAAQLPVPGAQQGEPTEDTKPQAAKENRKAEAVQRRKRIDADRLAAESTEAGKARNIIPGSASDTPSASTQPHALVRARLRFPSFEAQARSRSRTPSPLLERCKAAEVRAVRVLKKQLPAPASVRQRSLPTLPTASPIKAAKKPAVAAAPAKLFEKDEQHRDREPTVQKLHPFKKPAHSPSAELMGVTPMNAGARGQALWSDAPSPGAPPLASSSRPPPHVEDTSAAQQPQLANLATQLEILANLRTQGLLSDAEFTSAKGKLLGLS